MKAVRAFIAIELPPGIQFRLGEVRELFTQSGTRCVRWVSPNNIHLTLQFLGETSIDRLERLSSHLQPIILAQESFSFEVEGVGAFPNKKHPRVLWVGIQAPTALSTIHQLVQITCSHLGLPVEDRDFSPHLTLGRVKREATPNQVQELSAILDETRVGLLGTVAVKSITLFRSDLHPEGPVYKALSHYTMKG